MTFHVCALADLDAQLRLQRPAGVVSLLGPDHEVPPVPEPPPRLMLRFHDIAAPIEGLVTPDAATVAKLLAFAAAFEPGADLLLHCWMGISRSPAAAYILACAASPPGAEARIAQALRAAAPSATPNPLLVRLADERLGREGRMSAAIAQIGRGREAAMGAPFRLDAETGRME